MKRRVVLIALMIVMLFVTLGSASANGLRITARAALTTLSLRAGIEYRFGRFLGVQADVGTSFMAFTADLCGVIYLLDDDSPWQVNLYLVVPNAGANWLFDGAMVTPGGSVGVSYRFANDLELGGLLGGGYPLFYVPGQGWETRELDQFPTKTIWPDAAIFVSFPTRR